MITAVDTSVLLDVFGADPAFGPHSKEAVRRCLAEGTLIACDIVWAETAANFPAPAAAEEAMQRLGVGFSPLDAATASSAGAAWRVYRKGGGERNRVIADFLIGAHARARAERLLTRDRGFYRTYFKRLPIMDPSKT